MNAPVATLLPSVIMTPRVFARLEIVARTQLSFGNVAGRFLRRELERAVVCLPEQLPPNVVSMHSQVRYVLNDDDTVTRTLVYPNEGAVPGQCLSLSGPLGVALIGLAEGAVMPFRDHQGEECQVAVERVIYQPERDGPVTPALPPAA